MIAPFEKPIYVTRPFLPPLEEYTFGLQEIWRNAWLTNHGPILQRFGAALGRCLRTDNIALFTNGTQALQIALRGFGITGDVITTPFTFAATTHALHWSNLQPVFADIEATHYTLDPTAVEAAISPRTEAILAVHIYGYPCRLRELAEIARRHRLLLIYDAAHAFGVTVDDEPIGKFGDASMFSFHATKLFHTIEGGLLVFKDPARKEIFDLLKDFGFADETEVVVPGTNAKMNEFQALMGLQLLDHVDGIIARRAAIDAIYRTRLNGLPGIRIPPLPASNVRFNFAYFPVEIDEAELGLSRDALYEELKQYNVFTRRYFYPLVPDLACYRHLRVNDPLTTARRVASRILALPIYDALAVEAVEQICEIFRHLCRSRGPKH